MDLEWQDKASCTKEDPEIWFANRPEQAQEICLHCPVMIECARWVLRVERDIAVTDRFGVYAGMTPMQRTAKDWRTMRRGYIPNPSALAS